MENGIDLIPTEHLVTCFQHFVTFPQEVRTAFTTPVLVHATAFGQIETKAG